MDDAFEPRSGMLRDLYWRTEILQLMFWLRGEGLGDVVQPALLKRFLGVRLAAGLGYLDRLAEEGYLHRVSGGFRLSEEGSTDGVADLVASFDELTRPRPAECAPACWCHLSATEAEACASRLGSQR